MNLSNFEEYIDEKIIERGLDYFYEGRVGKIEIVEGDIYTAQVEGSEDYSVEIQLDSQKQIVQSNCECPFDWGDFCKHEIAMLYALREETSNFTQKPKKKSIAKKKNLKDVLSGQSKEELISIILDLAKDYKDIENRITLQYAADKDEISIADKLIKDYIKKATHRGFIEWNQVGLAVKGAEITLQNVRSKLDTGNIESAVSLSTAVLSNVVDMLQYCDDSSGTVGSVIHESIYLINTAVSRGKDNLSDFEQQQLFFLIMKEANHKRYEGWTDWRFDLLQSCIEFCANQELRTILELQLDVMIEEMNKDEWSGKYYETQIKKLQLELIERFDGKNKADAFIEKNIKHSDFRKKAILIAFDKADYHRVIKLSLDGEKTNQDYPGLINQWKEYRYQAYEKLGERDQQRQLALELLYENKSHYYLELRKLYQPEEWEDILEVILNQFEQQAYRPSVVYEEILIKEQLTSRLLEYCKGQVHYITHFYQHLIEDFPKEVDELFVTYVKGAANSASNRREYKKACKIIKNYKKACGSTNTERLIDELKEKHKNRPAFLDELEKVR
ncbi:hypothetical protein [Bacillus sp. CECT 9360]|uniref:SWIM zinc finger family protein n=1 Tax=Bacillus sp. CECT 9360 TaxID=2845821 RepID=UPI001E2E5DE0|nr:hypothetical protein [Bacillus sp. CECT 9360]CAH0347652.1 hypothetical protein BCI9360_04069 [Bacillus sp. CECT 9360]